MQKKFHEISDENTIYVGELTETIEGEGLKAVKVYDLRISRAQDVKKLFESLIIGQVVTIILDGRQMDFYKSVANQAEFLISTKP